jgi:glutamine synthetase
MSVNLVAVYDRYMSLDQGIKVQCEYIWIDGSGASGVRSKTKTVDRKPASVDDLPIWNFDGSSTEQAPGHDSEVLLKPVRMVPDPFRGGDNLLVLCECLNPDMTVHASNTRAVAKERFGRALDSHPWYGIEQEYTLFHMDGVTPLGWPKGGFPGPQGPYYCSAGAGNAFGRMIVEAHYRCCLYAGLKVSGINAEVMPGQWEYQVGPCEGIESGDHLWLSRYMLIRVAEDFDVKVSFEPKPIPGDWNGAGCHCNYSTAAMREEGGYEVIIDAVKKLEGKHDEHIAVYGKDNELRLTGKHETGHIGSFSYGVANRGASVRIPRDTEREGKGYFEDRRPASNIDPYEVTGKILATTVLDE